MIKLLFFISTTLLLIACSGNNPPQINPDSSTKLPLKPRSILEIAYIGCEIIEGAPGNGELTYVGHKEVNVYDYKDHFMIETPQKGTREFSPLLKNDERGVPSAEANGRYYSRPLGQNSETFGIATTVGNRVKSQMIVCSKAANKKVTYRY